MTYRTIIAFLSEGKAITIHINKFGEQFLDLFSLVIIWIITIVGLIILIYYIKKEEKTKEVPFTYKEIVDDKKPHLFFNIEKNQTREGFVNSSKDIDYDFDLDN